MKKKLDLILKDSYNDPDLAKLKLCFFLLIVFSLFLTSCGGGSHPLLDCLNSPHTGPIQGKNQYLCISNDVEGDLTSELPCMINSDGVKYSSFKSDINEMYREAFEKVWRDTGEWGDSLEKSDMKDAGEITAGHLFGDLSGDPGGSNNEVKYHCADSWDVKVSKSNFDGNGYYGLDPSESDVGNVKEDGGISHFPLGFYCYSDVKNRIVIQPFKSEPEDDEETFWSFRAYICLKNSDDQYYWKSIEDMSGDADYDADQDGAPDIWDCDDDNPNVYPDLSVFEGLETVKYILSDVCGDGVTANACQDPASSSPFKLYDEDMDHKGHNFKGMYEERYGPDYLEKLRSASDNCDENPYACENNCLKANHKCDYLITPGDDDGDGDITESEYEAIVPGDPEGYCCGADQIDDLGELKDFDGYETKICLSKDSSIVGSKPGFDVGGITCSVGGTDEGSTDYCWIGPASNNAKFNIFTLKEVGETTYDIISDGNEWFFCDGTGTNIDYSLKEFSNNQGERETTSRFYCFEQGDNYAWAECSNEDAKNEDSFKHSTAGDGLFRFPTSHLTEPSKQITLNLDSLGYDDYYEQDVWYKPSFSFEGYDFLEFYVNFDDDLSFPVDIFLTIEGEDNLVYFDQQVLGFAINTPQLDGSNKSLHIKIPIDEWSSVKQLLFLSNSDYNEFMIENVFLSKNSSDPLICSGKESTVGNYGAYIDDLDYTEQETEVNGELICEAYYGSDAWFGDADEDEVSSEQASCCGDDLEEYYAGKTMNGVATRGCWNGEVVYNDETMMNVEYTVNYEVVEFEATYDPMEYSLQTSFNEHPNNDDTDYSVTEQHTGFVTALDGPVEAGKFLINMGSSSQFYGGSSDQNINDGIVKYSFSKDEENHSSEVEAYWFIKEEQRKLSGDTFEADIDNYPYPITLQLFVETNHATTENSTDNRTETYKFPCTQTECTYGLPGSPPYEITNEYPHLYELYFVHDTDDETDTLISETKTFYSTGNLRVKKVSQQILFTADDTNEEGNYWGCSASNKLVPSNSTKSVYTTEDHDATAGENLGHCSTKGSYYCAYQDNNFLINSWSRDPIVDYGYEALGLFEEGIPFHEQFEPAKCGGDFDCDASARNQSTYIVPGRNMISNPSFEDVVHNKDIFGWELLNSDNQFDFDEKEFLDSSNEEIFNVDAGYTLRTSKLSLMQNKDYYFSHSGTCGDPVIYIVDVNGDKTGPLTVSFHSGENIYVSISFSDGDCTVHEPMLQLVDEDYPTGVNSFNNPQDYLFYHNLDSISFPSKGAACCPESWCWNGFMCVESMDKTTYLHEDINNRTYRCIDGDWSYLDPKYDWNQEEWGFCNLADQCFVTSSLSEGANPDAIPEDFYGSDLSDPYATCINDTQYIFDHYCNAGEWMSRTRFLVTKLLDYAENDDYVLSCDRPQKSLLDYDVPGYGYSNYIIGGSSAEVTNVSSLSSSINGTPTSVSTVDVCFNSVETSDTGKRLVPTDENTCINNVCVLKYNSGGEFKTAFATSMNIPLNDSNSFLIPLEEATSGTSVDYCADEISSSNQFVDCTENVKYSSKINSLIYSEDELSISTSVVDDIFEWFGDLFTGDEDEETEEFLDNSVNYNKVYLTSLNNEQYIVRSVEDVTADGKMILSEYSGFDFNVCDYVFNIDENYVMTDNPLEPGYLVSCNISDDDFYQVSVTEYTDFWWPQLTGSLRIPNE